MLLAVVWYDQFVTDYIVLFLMASIPPNLDSKLGANFSPTFGLKFSLLGFFVSLGGSFVKGVNCPEKKICKEVLSQGHRLPSEK